MRAMIPVQTSRAHSVSRGEHQTPAAQKVSATGNQLTGQGWMPNFLPGLSLPVSLACRRPKFSGDEANMPTSLLPRMSAEQTTIGNDAVGGE